MSDDATLSIAERLVRLLDHLGISRAHVCTRTTREVTELVQVAPERIASITVQGALARPEDLGSLADRTFWLLGDEGPMAKLMAPRLAEQPADNVNWLKGCENLIWSDTVAERADEVARALQAFLARMESSTPLPAITLSGEGKVAGVSYRAAGEGTPVVLLPLGLAAHQWDAMLPLVQARHCTVILGGRHVGAVETLESRASGDYSRMALGVLDLAEPKPTDSLIEVGCGSGALLRRIARRSQMARVVGLDINSYLLGEARLLAAAEGLADRLELHEGSAEAIPFPDNAFDVAFSSTVMEEVDAGRMLAEMVRVTRPGGRVAVIVRAVDRGFWTNLPLPEALKETVEAPTGLAGVSAGGCADDSLYRRFHEVGLTRIQGGPAWAWIRPGDPFWEFMQRQLVSRLTSLEVEAWARSLAEAQAAGLPVWIAFPHHCAVGTK